MVAGEGLATLPGLPRVVVMGEGVRIGEPGEGDTEIHGDRTEIHGEGAGWVGGAGGWQDDQDDQDPHVLFFTLLTLGEGDGD